MMDYNEVSYLKDDGTYIEHYDLEDRATKYVRNLTLGLNQRITIEQLEDWLRIDCRLSLLPPSNVLEMWLRKWTPLYLAEWSYNNDFVNKTKEN